MSNEAIRVEVAYALPHEQAVLPLKLTPGATAGQAIEQSGILERFPDIDLNNCRIGIFSKACQLDTVLHDRDRVEIYRPLLADPKEARKQRAERAKERPDG